MVRLIALGSGGLAREAAAAVRAGGGEFVGCLDDDPGTHGRPVAGREVLGGMELLAELLAVDPALRVLLCVGSARRPASRRALAHRLNLPMHRYATVVHPAAAVDGATTIGAGSVVLAGVVATADVSVGAFAVLMPTVVLTHDDHLADGVTIAAGARLAGGVRVEADAYIGSGALIREGVTIGAAAVVGMGAVVLGDVPAGQTWVGNPARRLRP